MLGIKLPDGKKEETQTGTFHDGVENNSFNFPIFLLKFRDNGILLNLIFIHHFQIRCVQDHLQATLETIKVKPR